MWQLSKETIMMAVKYFPDDIISGNILLTLVGRGPTEEVHLGSQQ